MNTVMHAGGPAHACDVCRLLYHDASPKPDAQYCSLCDAWLCDHCRSHWTQRAVAAILRAGELMTKGRAHGDTA